MEALDTISQETRILSGLSHTPSTHCFRNIDIAELTGQCQARMPTHFNHPSTPTFEASQGYMRHPVKGKKSGRNRTKYLADGSIQCVGLEVDVAAHICQS